MTEDSIRVQTVSGVSTALPGNTDDLVSRATLEEIPIIDLGPYLSAKPGALEKIADEIRHACEQIGFFFIINHGVPADIVNNAFSAMQQFFVLPAAQKSTVRMNRHQCGWQAPKVAVHGDSFEEGVKPQAGEAFKFTFELSTDDPDYQGSKRFRGHNQWPTALPLDAKTNLLMFLSTFDTLAKRLLAPLAVSLDVPATYFNDAFKRSSSMMRCAYYPVVPVADVLLGSPAHTDLSMLTLIPPATAPGLQILTASGKWIDQPVIPNAVLVNTGNTLRTWVNDRYIATPHRVLGSTEHERYSAIFFLYPDVDAVIECVPTCSSQDNPAKYPAIAFSDFHAGYAQRNFAYAEVTV